ncbi:hypothetical protein DOE78_02330 [Bacillus sp. Y1]|nr:hypothetical protein DOE78_02330 [Bacillus sp. Y1]
MGFKLMIHIIILYHALIKVVSPQKVKLTRSLKKSAISLPKLRPLIENRFQDIIKDNNNSHLLLL